MLKQDKLSLLHAIKFKLNTNQMLSKKISSEKFKTQDIVENC